MIPEINRPIDPKMWVSIVSTPIRLYDVDPSSIQQWLNVSAQQIQVCVRWPPDTYLYLLCFICRQSDARNMAMHKFVKPQRFTYETLFNNSCYIDTRKPGIFPIKPRHTGISIKSKTKYYCEMFVYIHLPPKVQKI